nr:lipoprotein involved with copper homeostasis and adhesion [Virgibacillus halodenitrificans]
MTTLLRRHLPVLISLSLTACAGTPQTQVDYVVPTEKFEGTLPCSDCSGIDTTLVLKRNAVTGEPHGFYLHETRIDAPGGERVDTTWGKWSKSRDITDFQHRIYVLQPENGATRVYAPRDNGDLQPLDTQGSPLTDDERENVMLRRMTPELSLSSSGTNNENLEDSDG